MQHVFIFYYLHQAHQVSVITCDKIIQLTNTAGFQQPSSTAFIYGQLHTAERAAAIKDAPIVSCCPSAKGYCRRGRASQKDSVFVDQPLRHNAQPSGSADQGTGLGTKAPDLQSSNQATYTCSTPDFTVKVTSGWGDTHVTGSGSFLIAGAISTNFPACLNYKRFWRSQQWTWNSLATLDVSTALAPYSRLLR